MNSVSGAPQIPPSCRQHRIRRRPPILSSHANALTVRAKRVRRVRVHVMDGMFDLSKPVSLRLGSRGWSGRVKPSAKCMLKHYAAERDASALILNEVDIDLVGKVTVRY